MTLHHVTCHVTVMSRASSSSLKRKIKIKPRKIDKRKRKILVSKVFHNTSSLVAIIFKLQWLDGRSKKRAQQGVLFN